MPATLLHPWAIGIGAAAMTLPIAIHLLARPRPRRMALPTIRFLRAAIDRGRARNRLGDWIVLALRTLAVAAIVVAFARPLLGERLAAEPVDDGATTRVIILDVSQSMGARDGDGFAAIDRARPIAARSLDYRIGLRADVILASATAIPVFLDPSINLATLRDTITNATVCTERFDVHTALAAAARLLRNTAAGQHRELVVISDFQRIDWTDASFDGVPTDTAVRLQSVAATVQPANIAITRVATVDRVEAGSPASFDIDVLNVSDARRHATIELSLAGQTARRELDLVAHATASTQITITPAVAGWASGDVRILDANDALPADDARPIAVRVAERAPIALITREPANPAATSSHFIERAFAPLADGTAGVVRLDPSALDTEALARVSAIVVDHPGTMTDADATRIAAFARQGRGLLYIAAEPIDGVNLDALARAAGSDWDLPVAFIASPEGVDRTVRRIESWTRDAPGIPLFGESADAVVRPLRFAGGLDTHPLNGRGLSSDVRITYADHSAALVVSTVGAGRVGVLNADLSRSNLVASPLFVPLIGELASRLLAHVDPIDPTASGQPVVTPLPAESDAEKLTITGPATADGLGRIEEEGGRPVWRWPRAGSAGVYRVMEGSRTIHALTTAAPGEESDLTPIDLAALRSRSLGQVAIELNSIRDAPVKHRDGTWPLALLIAGSCLIVELFITGRSTSDASTPQ